MTRDRESRFAWAPGNIQIIPAGTASASARTSATHPLEIAEVTAGATRGRIGITFCPGKKQPDAASGTWDRNLGVDIAAVEAWGASAVVTLVEEHELRSLGVEGLGDAVRRRHLEWLHLPIADVGVPRPAFEARWNEVSEGLRARLRDGFGVVVHCKGGLGRAGMTAARLLVELGEEPSAAVAAVRVARPGAIETAAQERYVLRCVAVPERQPPRTEDAIRDRAIGALVGLAIGDAVGTTLEFARRDSYEPLTEMIGGGPFRRKPGEWTDDTAMGLALAESLRGRDDLDERDLLTRFLAWRDNGAYACVGVCDDIGITVSEALESFRRTGEPYSGPTDPLKAGNGSLMRLAPVAIRFWRNRERMRDVAARQSRTTHGAPEAVDACVLFAEMLADAIEGKPRSEIMRERAGTYAGKIGDMAAGAWRGKLRQDVRGSGYVAASLDAALWSVGRTGDFRSAVLTAANLGDDADTTAAIAGQLAGALYGLSGIPVAWREKLAWRDRIEEIAAELLLV